ncbi:unnamed protein product, partial [Ectocarpus sp. 8 AP-2014]
GGGGGRESKRKRHAAGSAEVAGTEESRKGLKPEAILAMKQVLKEIKKAEDPEDGRLCCELYKKVPPRREFKAYYEVIENPIDLQMISSRVRKGEYHTLAAFESDVM